MGFLKRFKNVQDVQREKEEIVNKTKSWNTRCTEFFQWFLREEPVFDKLLSEQKSEEANEYLIEGLNRWLPGIDGRIGQRKLMFQVGEHGEALYLLSSLNFCMPDELKKRWQIQPNGKNPDAVFHFVEGEGKEWSANVKEALAFLRPTQNGCKLPLELLIYLPDLPEANEEKRKNMAWYIGRAAAGEMAMCWCVEKYNMIDEKVQGMFPAAQLEQKMTEIFRSVYGGTELPEFSEGRVQYERQPKKGIGGYDVREDILEGFTSCENLVQEYFEKREDTFERFLAYGVIPMYLYVPADQMNDEIHRRLEGELEAILRNEQGDKKLGVYLGFAIGENNFYYEFLMLDKTMCMEKIDQMRQAYVFDFTLSEFRQTWKKIVSRKGMKE